MRPTEANKKSYTFSVLSLIFSNQLNKYFHFEYYDNCKYCIVNLDEFQMHILYVKTTYIGDTENQKGPIVL